MPPDIFRNDLVRVMLDPAIYEDPVTSVEHEATHISRVFLTDDLVFKVKRPVHLPFVDYSTLARRLFFCREEVRLNRRLAPDVYLGVVPILEERGRFRVAASAQTEGHGRVVEYAVRMRRVPDAIRLDARLEAGTVDDAVVESIAARLAGFHARSISKLGRELSQPDRVGKILLENLREARDVLPAENVDTIEASVRDALERHRDLLARRARTERGVEGHGDLRVEHVYVPDDGPPFAIDCVEFDEALRTGDAVSDLAFLTMDLEASSEPVVARRLAHAWAKAAGDDDADVLLPLYECHRAAIRAKVDGLKASDDELDASERQRARLRGLRFLRLALRKARGETPPRALVIVFGLSGTGKTTVARLLSVDTGYSLLRSDVVRKRLAGVPPRARVRPEEQRVVYGEELSRRTYASLLDEAGGLLRSGEGVVVDATFLASGHRRPFLDLARDLDVPVLFVECRADEQEVLRRLEERSGRADEISDADVEIYRRQKRKVEATTDIPEDRFVIADAGEDLALLLSRLRERLALPPTS